MTDSADHIDEEANEASVSLATAKDFGNSSLAAFLESYCGSDSYEFEDALSAAAKVAQERGADSDARVFSLVAALMSCHLRVDDPAESFGPKLVWEGRRSLIPSDIRGEQADVIAAVTPTISHPYVRARLGDIAFTLDRRHHQAGRAAMEAYCAIATGRLDGTLACRIPGLELSVHDVVLPIKRALKLMRLLHKRDKVPGVVRDTFTRAYSDAVAQAKYFPFVELAEAGQVVGLIPIDQVANDGEAIAASAPSDAYPQAVKRVWAHAAACYDWLERPEDERRCRLQAAEQTLKMREHCSGAMAHAHWTKAAIGEFRQIQGTKDRVAALLEELRQLQMSVRDEMSVFSTTIDLTDERKEAIDLFQGISLPEAIIQMISMVQPPDVDELKGLVLEQAKNSPLSSIMAASYHDEDGKEVARVDSAPLDGEPSDHWYKANAVRYMEFVRLTQVSGRIEPARRTLMDRFPIEERHVAPIAYLSPFVPHGHAPLFALGFARMFQGDYVSASHILFLQLEAALRHVLIISNRDSSKIDSDLLQGDRALSAMLDVNRGDLEAIFGRNVVYEIDLLFNCRPGPAMRNELAHGKMSYDAFHQPVTIWGCWFMLNLACRPLIRQWNEKIAPEIEAAL